MVRTKNQRKEIVRKYPAQKEVQRVSEEKKIEVDYSPKKSRNMLWFVALISIIFCFFAISFLFARASVIVNPKINDIVLSENLSAGKDLGSGLSFRLMIVSAEESKTVQAVEEKDLEVKAVGTVVIFNSFSSASQTLSIDTRLEGSNGKIYKTDKKIIVPGMSKDGVPGKAEVNIYAAEAGEEYNSGPLDFTIPGFKDTPKYSKFTGRSKTGTEIAGGFKGKAPVVSDADKAKAIEGLKNNLQEKLLQKSTDYPDDFILFKGAIFYDINDSNTKLTYNEDKSLTLTLKGTLYGFLFNEQKLTEKIVKNNIEKYDGSPIYISNIKDLVFSVSNTDSVSPRDVQNINFNLSGPVKIVWKVDLNKFVVDLLGKSKKDFNQILLQYTNIDSASLALTPFWKMSIPDKIKNINIIVNYPK